jgi:hypothetical protein
MVLTECQPTPYVRESESSYALTACLTDGRTTLELTRRWDLSIEIRPVAHLHGGMTILTLLV